MNRAVETDKELSLNELTERAANLQSFNMEFVKKLDRLKQDYRSLNQAVHQEESNKAKIEREIKSLQLQLDSTQTQLQHLYQLVKKIKTTIQETEAAYHQILTSSETLLHGLSTQSESIQEALHHFRESQ